MPDECAILKKQTNRTKLFNNILSDELLSLSRQCAVVKDDDVARAEKSFEVVYLPTLEINQCP